MKAEELPKEMQSKSVEERKAYLEKMTKERETIQKEIVELSAERAKFIDVEMKKKNLSADASFDEVVRRTIQEQAAKQLNK